ncbi:hypothetical protein EVAR_61938_1 [Eumeta japonica]|uniref:Uncharacterized protein n=1 Tax=Eumeta variegata TaxID=151549 RepID=A0A4C1ZIT7_EUMVA|nr:hypothetical protein EVAR_61938_1 [Eumeta japonica]
MSSEARSAEHPTKIVNTNDMMSFTDDPFVVDHVGGRQRRRADPGRHVHRRALGRRSKVHGQISDKDDPEEGPSQSNLHLSGPEYRRPRVQSSDHPPRGIVEIILSSGYSSAALGVTGDGV